jgi:ribosomal protein L37E
MAQIINRYVEVCNTCGAWNSFHRGKNGTSVYFGETETRRIYGECKRCGAKMIVIVKKLPPTVE